MQAPITCAIRTELRRQWSEATGEFSEAVDSMKANVSADADQFALIKPLAEKALRNADRTRLLFEMHRAEHGC
jgi:hypothetical protein